MIIRKNFGATHFIIGRDMAGTKSTLDSEDFYGAFEAQEMGKKHSAELEVTVVDYPNMVYVGEEHGNERGYISDKVAKEKGLKIAKLSSRLSGMEVTPSFCESTDEAMSLYSGSSLFRF